MSKRRCRERVMKITDTKADAERFWALRPANIGIKILHWSVRCSAHNCMF